MSKKRALVFHTFKSTFVTKDMDILSEQYGVSDHNFYSDKKYKTPLQFLSQTVFLLRKIWGADLLLCQFAGYHSFLPSLYAKITGKPCIIVVGGTEAHYFPGIGYGNWQKGLVKCFTILSFKLCSHIAPKHKTLMFTEYTYDEKEPNPQGIYARLPGLKTPYTEITNGYDAAKWQRSKEKRKNTFITVAHGWEYGFQVQLKGIDLIFQIAPFFPECEFAILGMKDDSGLPDKPVNVTVLPPAKNEELTHVFSAFEFYLQLSIAEGFPNALCEAMLCECIPVGSNVFSIPEIIGDSGFILMKRDINELKLIMQKALNSNRLALMKRSRERIAQNYTLEKRKVRLLDLCNSLTR
jgi:glycosyltransferase involved in cell wall biosynthesis